MQELENSSLESLPQYFFEISNNEQVCGFAWETANEGEKVLLCYRNFLSPYNGTILYRILDQISSKYLKKWLDDTNKKETCINNCLILISKEKSEVYINIPTKAEMISKRAVLKGDAITTDDIGDIRKIHLEGIDINTDCGIIYIFSYKWMKCVYFDYSQVLPDNIQTEEELNKYKIEDIEFLFASLHAYMIFPEVLMMKPEVEEKMFDRGWFPFIRLLGSRFKLIHDHLVNNLSIEYAEIEVVDSFDNKIIKKLTENWMKKEVFKKHEKIIETGIQRYLEGDYISSIHVLYPRIEGLMRYIYLGTNGKATQKSLVDKLIQTGKGNNPKSNLFLLDKFNIFLTKFYFNNFDLENGEVDLSRNSLSHGVVSENELNRIRAFQGILILDQIFYYV